MPSEAETERDRLLAEKSRLETALDEAKRTIEALRATSSSPYPGMEAHHLPSLQQTKMDMVMNLAEMAPWEMDLKTNTFTFDDAVLRTVRDFRRTGRRHVHARRGVRS